MIIVKDVDQLRGIYLAASQLRRAPGFQERQGEQIMISAMQDGSDEFRIEGDLECVADYRVNKHGVVRRIR
jgi:hypothetical protein